ncbi:xylulokinase [Candidatus Bipolaricaulota bacterium]|nr:xylulokinase [Candidatus Bipolaricaulota bacterium]
MSKVILSHDLGTTGNKATLFDTEGNLLASSYNEYPTNYFGHNCVEQNPNDWWEAVCSSTKGVLAEANILPKDIACVSFSGHMMACLPVDKNANPLRPCIIWADSRSVEQAQRLVDQVGMEEGYKITGHQLLAMYSAAKIMWVKDNEPEVFKKTYKFLHVKDFITAKLTGAFVTDLSDASGMDLFDLKKREWSEHLLRASQIPVEILPDPHPSTYVAGEVTKKAAEEVGLIPGIPVVIGGGDGPCAAVGSGVVREGNAYNYFGSAAWIGIAASEPVYDPQMRTFTFFHLDPDLFMPVGASNNGGYSYQCFRDAVWSSEKAMVEDLNVNIYDMMGIKAAGVTPGADKLLYLPYIRGERCPYNNPNARGVFLGLTPNHKREHLTRAVLEGVVLNQRMILDALESQGAQVKEMCVIGGGAQSSLWRQIMADVYNKRILQPRLLQEATSLGAAIAGGVGVGLFKDFKAAEKMVQIVSTQDPNPEAHERYEKLYPVFKAAYSALVPIFEDLAHVDA